MLTPVFSIFMKVTEAGGIHHSDNPRSNLKKIYSVNRLHKMNIKDYTNPTAAYLANIGQCTKPTMDSKRDLGNQEHHFQYHFFDRFKCLQYDIGERSCIMFLLHKI